MKKAYLWVSIWVIARTHGKGHIAAMITLRSYARLKYVALGLFLVLSGCLLAYNHFIAAPRQKCEQAGAWWSNKDRVCAAPIYLPTITGREPGKSEATIDWHEDKTAPAATGTGQ